MADQPYADLMAGLRGGFEQPNPASLVKLLAGLKEGAGAGAAVGGAAETLGGQAIKPLLQKAAAKGLGGVVVKGLLKKALKAGGATALGGVIGNIPGAIIGALLTAGDIKSLWDALKDTGALGDKARGAGVASTIPFGKSAKSEGNMGRLMKSPTRQALGGMGKMAMDHKMMTAMVAIPLLASLMGGGQSDDEAAIQAQRMQAEGNPMDAEKAMAARLKNLMLMQQLSKMGGAVPQGMEQFGG
jgi:hypothetical protein